MDRFKFRLWDSEDNTMFTGVEIEEMRLRDLDSFEFGEFMQYTGLSLINDKAKEIYDGDILGTFNGLLYEVYWSDHGEWRVRFLNTDHKGQDQGSLSNMLYNSYIKIKGNIHENKNLLGDTNE